MFDGSFTCLFGGLWNDILIIRLPAILYIVNKNEIAVHLINDPVSFRRNHVPVLSNRQIWTVIYRIPKGKFFK